MSGMPVIIGISGRKRSGKDTVAGLIVGMLPKTSKTSFADPIKAMLKWGLGLSWAQLYGDQKEVMDVRYGRTPRELMQSLGTEWGRDLVGADVWVFGLKQLLDGQKGTTVVIPDVRFENEAALCRKYGYVIHVERPGLPVTDVHRSEVGIAFHPDDRVILNDGSLAELKVEVEMILGLRDAVPARPCKSQRQGDEWFCAECALRWGVEEGATCRRTSAE